MHAPWELSTLGVWLYVPEERERRRNAAASSSFDELATLIPPPSGSNSSSADEPYDAVGGGVAFSGAGRDGTVDVAPCESMNEGLADAGFGGSLGFGATLGGSYLSSTVLTDE